MVFLSTIKRKIQNDPNLQRVQSYSRRAAKALPRASLEYAVEKVPIVQWLPRYSPRWIWNDLVAGLTVGVLLVCTICLCNVNSVLILIDTARISIC
jgi:sodium-independent sulfate anion transporter 11